VVRRGEKGFTLLEVLVSMTVFGIFLAVMFALTAEMRGWEKRLPVNMYKHPMVATVLTRLRRDVMDAHGSNPYKEEFAGYKSTEQVLIVESVQPNGGVRTIVWDFRTPGTVRRREYNVGVSTSWVARGMPKDLQSFKIGAISTKSAAWALEITGYDEKGRMAIYQVIQPRATADLNATTTASSTAP
jgi:prepilin-type N-terminal cleavage/methylation domain-containing protein